jgi:DNA-binding response OmpR family regulator
MDRMSDGGRLLYNAAQGVRPCGKKVLVVDDEYLIRYSMQKIIEHEGCSAITAGSGHEALHLFDEQKPDVVILDIHLPDTNGLVLLKTIKEISPSAVVIMVTACPDVQGSVKAIKMGALDYLEKPVNIEHLKRLLHAGERRRLKESRVGPAGLIHLYERWQEKNAVKNQRKGGKV